MGPRLLRKFFSFSICAALLVAFVACPLSAQKTSAPSTPQVVVIVNLRNPDLMVIDHKYRVFYNKFERKNLPIEGYDLTGALRDEVMNALGEDKRFQWRTPSEDDKLDTAAICDEKRRTAAMLAGARADRVLVVDVDSFAAFISGLAKDRMEILAQVTMLDRATGKKLWKTRIWEKIPFSGDLQKLQADNQKELRLGINSLIEKTSAKLKSKVAESKV